MSVLREAQQNKQNITSLFSLSKYTKKQKAERMSARSFVMHGVLLRKRILCVVPLGTVLRWYTTECLRDVALIRPGFAGPPSPSGKALLTRYNFAVWYHL